MKAHIVTVINSRTRGLATMMMGNLRDEDSNHHASSDESMESEENCTAWKSGTSRKSSLNLVLIHAKAKEEGRVKLTENVSAVDALVTSEQIAEPKLTSMEDPPKSAPKGKVLEIARMKRQRPHKMCHWGQLMVGSFEVSSDHGDDMDGDESTYETTEMMPPPPPDSWFKKTETLFGKFRKPCNEDHRDEEDPFHDCWDGKQETVRRFAAKSVPDVKGCFSANFPVCSVCQKLGVYQRLPIIT